MGAQACGHLAYHFYETNQTRLDRISGIDPAGPGFYSDNSGPMNLVSYGNLPEDFNFTRLDASDADLVDIYHGDSFLSTNADYKVIHKLLVKETGKMVIFIIPLATSKQ